MVPSYNRKPSNVEFLDTARELVIHTLRYTNKKFAKKDMDTVRAIRNMALKILGDVVFANSIYVNTQEDKNMRHSHFMSAKGNLYALNTLLSVINDPKLMQTTITAYGWSRWGELIGKEINLISQIIKTDLKREIK